MIAVRPAVPADRELIQDLVRGLSPRSRYLRFFNGMRELAPYWLQRFASADPMGDFTLLAFESGTPVAMAQYSANPYPERCEFGVVVADAWQGRGIGKRLVRDLVAVAGAAGFQRVEGEVLAENEPMLRLLRGMGFRIRRDPESALAYRVSCRQSAPQTATL